MRRPQHVLQLFQGHGAPWGHSTKALWWDIPRDPGQRGPPNTHTHTHCTLPYRGPHILRNSTVCLWTPLKPPPPPLPNGLNNTAPRSSYSTADCIDLSLVLPNSCTINHPIESQSPHWESITPLRVNHPIESQSPHWESITPFRVKPSPHLMSVKNCLFSVCIPVPRYCGYFIKWYFVKLTHFFILLLLFFVIWWFIKIVW